VKNRVEEIKLRYVVAAGLIFGVVFILTFEYLMARY
jgi:hypothetical protein